MEQLSIFNMFDFDDDNESAVSAPTSLKEVKAEAKAEKEPKETKKADKANDTKVIEGNFNTEDAVDLEAEDDGDDTVSEATADETKAAAAKTTTTKKAPKSYDAPIKVIGNGWETQIGEPGTKLTGDKICKALYEAGYHEVLVASISITKKAPFTVYVNTVGGHATSDDDALCEVTVGLGQFKVSLNKDNFEGLDEKEISVFDVAEKFYELYPDFAGCSLSVHNGDKYATPVFEKSVKVKKGQNYRVWTDEGIKELSGDSILESGATAYKSNTDVYFLAYNQSKDIDRIICPKIVEQVSSKKAQEIYRLPLTLWLETYGKKAELKSENFDGKTSLTQEEIKDYLKQYYRIFKSSNHQISFNYDRNSSTLGIAIVSGRKGAALAAPSKVIDFPFWRVSALKDRIEETVVGIFTGKEDTKTHLVTGVDFKMSLPKIPYFFLKAIIAEFKKDLTKENMVQIYYSVNDGSYYMVRPQAEYSKISVKYKMTHTNDFLVLSVHSHNTMPARFSSIDDADEIYTGLFGVIGDLDKKEITMSFRAGMEGSFKELSYTDIFDMGGDVA